MSTATKKQKLKPELPDTACPVVSMGSLLAKIADGQISEDDLKVLRTNPDRDLTTRQWAFFQKSEEVRDVLRKYDILPGEKA